MSASARAAAADELSAELESKLLSRLVAEWEGLNYAYFKEALRRPVLRLSDTRARLGQWNGALRSLELSRPLVLERPWVEVIEVLKHEIAHQFVDECLAVDEGPHGPTFRSVCDRLGIDGRPSGLRAPPSGPDDAATDRVVERIRKLLALARSPNLHEAESAAMAARKLMLKFNIEVDRAAAGPSARSHGYRHLGRPSGRILEHDRRLASILTTYFFVECLWIPVYRPREGKRGSVLEICGRPANLAMAEHVHAFLSATALRLWGEYKRSGQGSTNRDRQAFLAGVMRGFESKLQEQNARFQEQGLVWVPTSGLDEYFRRRHPRTQTIRRSGSTRNEAFSEGQRQGRQIVLSKPVEDSPDQGPARRRALPPSRG